jgi:hypothetical protein
MGETDAPAESKALQDLRARLLPMESGLGDDDALDLVSGDIRLFRSLERRLSSFGPIEQPIASALISKTLNMLRSRLKNATAARVRQVLQNATREPDRNARADLAEKIISEALLMIDDVDVQPARVALTTFQNQTNEIKERAAAMVAPKPNENQGKGRV